MEVVPDLRDISSAIIHGASTSSSLVVSGTAATNVGQSTVSSGQSILELADGVCGGVARLDAGVVQPAPGRKTAVVEDGGLEELDNLLVLDVFGAVARHIESREASSVLAEFVSPEITDFRVSKKLTVRASDIPIRSTLVDPVLVHPRKEVVFAERLEESANVGALVRWDNSTIGQTVGSVGRRCRVVLSVQVAVLSVRAIAEVRP